MKVWIVKYYDEEYNTDDIVYVCSDKEKAINFLALELSGREFVKDWYEYDMEKEEEPISYMEYAKEIAEEICNGKDNAATEVYTVEQYEVN